MDNNIAVPSNFRNGMTAKETLNQLLEDDGLLLLEGWSRDGYSMSDIAEILGINLMTLYKWRNKFPQIDEAMKAGKEVIDYKVESALLKCALGYKTKEVKTTTIMRFGKVVETQKEVLEKENAPNVQAITLWLTNRNKEKWKTPNSKSLLDEVEEDTSIQVTVTRAGKDEVNGETVNEGIEVTKVDEGETDWADSSSDADWAEAMEEFED